MIKKAMILAAGLGTRLRPLTTQLPKPLVPIANQALLSYHLTQLAELGVEEVMLNLHHLPEPIQTSLGDGSRWGLRLHYSLEQPRILGTGGGLAEVADFFAKEERFLFINGDILHNVDWRVALAAHEAQGVAATLLLRPHPLDGKTGWIGVDDTGRVRRVPDMPEEPHWTKRMFTGLHILTPAILPHLPRGQFGCVLRTGYRALLEAGVPIGSHFIGDTYWRDIGTPASYLQANWEQLARLNPQSTAPLLDSNVKIGPNVQLGPRVIVGEGAQIGAGCALEEVVIWPGAQLAPGTQLKRAIVFGEKILEINDPPN